QLDQRRHAVDLVALEGRQIDLAGAGPAQLRKLCGIAAAAVEGALQVAELEGEDDALGVGAAILLAADHGLNALLERRDAAVDWSDRCRDVLRPRNGLEL